MMTTLDIRFLTLTRQRSQRRAIVRAYYGWLIFTAAVALIAFAVLARAIYVSESSAVGTCWAASLLPLYVLTVRAGVRLELISKSTN